MNRVGWAGKVIGAILGLLLSKFSLIGALIGALIGHQFDKGLAGGATGNRFSAFSSAARQKVFFETVFIAMGRLAKADGSAIASAGGR